MDTVQKSDPPSEREKWEAEVRLREREIALKEREADQRSRDQRGGRWTNPLVLAVLAAALAATGNALVAWINGSAQRELENGRLIGQQKIEEAKAEAQRILEVIKTGDPDKAAENLEFLLKAGLISDDARRTALANFLEKRSPGQGPSTPSPVPQPLGTPPNYKVPLPSHNPAQTAAATRLLELAVTELNRNVDESTSLARIAEYSKAAGSTGNLRGWSGAFISWLLKESGSGELIKLSGSNLVLWNDARKKGLTYIPNEKPMLPGDIVVFVMLAGRDVQIADVRSGTVSGVSAHAGVILSLKPDTFVSIEANVGNALNLREHKVTDQIVGFIRVTDHVAKIDEPPAEQK